MNQKTLDNIGKYVNEEMRDKTLVEDSLYDRLVTTISPELIRVASVAVGTLESAKSLKVREVDVLYALLCTGVAIGYRAGVGERESEALEKMLGSSDAQL